jgi:aspartate-semialdehyde dehydrogenase
MSVAKARPWARNCPAEGRLQHRRAEDPRRHLTCQGGDYTNEVFPKLREAGWQGYWIDAARRCACRTTP